MRFALCVAMLAVCLVASQCIATGPAASHDAPDAAGGAAGVPGEGAKEDKSKGVEEVEEEEPKEEEVRQEMGEEEVVVNRGSKDVNLSNSQGNGVGKGVGGTGAVVQGPSSNSGVGTGGDDRVEGVKVKDGSSGLTSPSGTALVPSAPPAGPQAGADASDKGQVGAGSVPVGVAPVGQGISSNSGARGAITGAHLSTSDPSSSGLSGSGKQSGGSGDNTVLVPGSGGAGTRPGGAGGIVTDGVSTGTDRSPGHSVKGSSVSPGSRTPSQPEAPVGEEVNPIKDPPGGSNGSKNLTPAPLKKSIPLNLTTKPTVSQTTPLATSVQTLKTTTSTAAPTDSTQTPGTTTTVSAKGDYTAPGTSLPKLSKTLQSMDTKDGSIGGSLTFAFTALVALVVMAAASAP